MTLHPLTSKRGAFVLKLGLVSKKERTFVYQKFVLFYQLQKQWHIINRRLYHLRNGDIPLQVANDMQGSALICFLKNDIICLIDKNLTGRLPMEKIWNEMYEAAKAVLNERRISEYVTCGEVSAAICSKSGKIYTGICIDTCSTLGICAERNAIFNMITNGEQEIDKVLCILSDGSNGAPCGACRELMVQLMAGNYYDIEIMLDYSTGKTIKLGEITPEWWIK